MQSTIEKLYLMNIIMDNVHARMVIMMMTIIYAINVQIFGIFIIKIE